MNGLSHCVGLYVLAGCCIISVVVSPLFVMTCSFCCIGRVLVHWH